MPKIKITAHAIPTSEDHCQVKLKFYSVPHDCSDQPDPYFEENLEGEIFINDIRVIYSAYVAGHSDSHPARYITPSAEFNIGDDIRYGPANYYVCVDLSSPKVLHPQVG